MKKFFSPYRIFFYVLISWTVLLGFVYITKEKFSATDFEKNKYKLWNKQIKFLSFLHLLQENKIIECSGSFGACFSSFYPVRGKAEKFPVLITGLNKKGKKREYYEYGLKLFNEKNPVKVAIIAYDTAREFLPITFLRGKWNECSGLEIIFLPQSLSGQKIVDDFPGIYLPDGGFGIYDTQDKSFLTFSRKKRDEAQWRQFLC